MYLLSSWCGRTYTVAGTIERDYGHVYSPSGLEENLFRGVAGQRPRR